MPAQKHCKTFSLRLTVASVFMTLVCLLVGIALGLQYYFSRDLARAAAADSCLGISERIEDRIVLLDRQSASLVNVLGQYDPLRRFPGEHEQQDALPLMAAAMKDNPYVYSMYVGYGNGDFFELISLNSCDSVRQAVAALPQDDWYVLRVSSGNGTRILDAFYLDSALDIRTSRRDVTDYDPRTRPWYQDARRSPGVVKTAPYMFSVLKSPGVTYARSMDERGRVVGVDISLAGLGDFLQAQRLLPGSEIFLFDAKGNVTAGVEKTDSANTTAPLPSLALTEAEQAFVSRHPVLRASNELDWPPFDFAIGGQPRGYSVDLLDLLAARAGLRVEYVNGYGWNQLVELFRSGDLDLLHSLLPTADREKMGIFTRPYMPMPQVVAMRKGGAIPATLAGLRGRLVAIPKGWATDVYLQAKHPEIRLLHVTTTLDALRAVLDGEADATLDSAPVLTYLKNAYFLDDIRLGREVAELHDMSRGLSFLIRPDWPELAGILTKALDSVTEEERSRLEHTWFDVGLGEVRQGGSMLASGLVPHPELLRLAGGGGTGGAVRQLTIKGEHYFGYVARLSSVYGSDEFIGFLIPVSEAIRPYMEKVRLSLLISCTLLVFAMPLVSYCASLIVRPINALMGESVKVKERRYDEVGPVPSRITEIVELSASMVSMASSIQKYEQNLHDLMDSFIQLIATAIDHKSPYTGGHCERVPQLAIMIAEAASKSTDAPFAGFKLSTMDEWREFRTAAWLHDCGKMTTPEYIVDKATKLETIYNRIHEIRMRFEVLLRDADIAYWRQRCETGRDDETLREELQQRRDEIRNDFAFIAQCNLGGEFMADDLIARVHRIGRKTWVRHLDDRLGLGHLELQYYPETAPDLPCEELLLADRPEHIRPRRDNGFLHDARHNFAMDVPEHLYNLGEIYNLCIKRGTLTEEDRYKINEHIIVTILMLEKLPYPSNMSRIPDFAGTHHETLIGTGYPRKLTADDISMPGRIMALADVFEALTASDRPYKQAKKLSEAIQILSFMVRDQHLDGDVFRLFLESGLYLIYAECFLRPDQIDAVDVDAYLGRQGEEHKPRS